jgi:hypothetical protein
VRLMAPAPTWWSASASVVSSWPSPEASA